MNPAKYAKTIAGAVLAALGIIYFALDDDVLTTQEWVQAAQVGLATGLGVYGIPNAASGKRAASG